MWRAYFEDDAEDKLRYRKPHYLAVDGENLQPNHSLEIDGENPFHELLLDHNDMIVYGENLHPNHSLKIDGVVDLRPHNDWIVDGENLHPNHSLEGYDRVYWIDDDLEPHNQIVEARKLDPDHSLEDDDGEHASDAREDGLQDPRPHNRIVDARNVEPNPSLEEDDGEHALDDVEDPGPHNRIVEAVNLQWQYIRKVYTIVAVQLLLSSVVGGLVVSYHPIVDFMTTTHVGYACYGLLMVAPFTTMLLLYYHHQRYPINYLLLGVFTVSFAFAVGLTCTFTIGKVILEALILTTTVVISLAFFTFWAAKRGYVFNFVRPFLFSAVIVLVVFSIIQIFFPMGKISVMVCGGLSAIAVCGGIVRSSARIIRQNTRDHYIWDAVCIYLRLAKQCMGFGA